MDNESWTTNQTVYVSLLDRRILTFLYSFIVLVGLIGNLLIVLAVFKTKQLRKRPQFILLNLIVCDLITSTVSAPYYIYSINMPIPKESAQVIMICRLYIYLSYTLGFISIFALMIISIDRYIAVKMPYRYQKYISNEVTIACIVLSWFIPFLVAFPAVIIDGWLGYDGLAAGFCCVHWAAIDKTYFSLLIIICFVVPTLIIFCTNIRVYLIAKKQKKVDDTRRRTISQIERRKSVKSEASESSVQLDPLERLQTAEKKGRPKNTERNAYRVDTADNTRNRGSRETGHTDQKIDSIQNDTNRKIIGRHDSRKSLSRMGSFRRLSTVVSAHGTRLVRSRSQIMASARDIQIAVGTLMLVICYLLSWLPFVIPRILTTFKVNIPNDVTIYTPAFAYSNVAWDPILILWCRKELRKGVCSLFCRPNRIHMKSENNRMKSANCSGGVRIS